MQKKLICTSAEGIVDTFGGELISYKKDGREYIWHGDPEHWSGHSPVLFPFVSALKNDTVRFAGKEKKWSGKHGFARKSEFELVSLSDTKAVFLLKESDKTLALYPYRFELYVTHEISEEGWKTTYSVSNTDSEPLPFCIGGHTGFEVDRSIEDYKLIFEKDEDCPLYYTDEKSLMDDSYLTGSRITGREFALKYADYDVDALIAKDIKSRRVKLVSKKDGSGVEFDYTGFPVLVLWTPPKKKSPFICLEAWLGLPAYVNESGNFEDKPFAVSLKPGENFSVSYTAKPINGIK